MRFEFVLSIILFYSSGCRNSRSDSASLSELLCNDLSELLDESVKEKEILESTLFKFSQIFRNSELKLLCDSSLQRKINEFRNKFINVRNFNIEKDLIYLELDRKLILFTDTTKAPFELIKNLSNTGFCYKNLKNYPQALIYFDSAIAMSGPMDIHPYIRLRSERMDCYLQLGELDNAKVEKDSGLRRINLLTSTENKYPEVLVRKALDAYVHMLNNFSTLCLIESNIEPSLMESTLAIHRLSNVNLPVDTNQLLGSLYSGLGYLTLEWGSRKNNISTNRDSLLKISEYYLQISKKKFELSGNAESYFGVIQNLSAYYERTNKWKKSHQLLSEIIYGRNFNLNPQHKLWLPLYLNLGTASYRMGRLQQAMEAYTLALQRIDSSADPLIRLPSVDLLSRDPETNLILLGSIGRTALRLAESDPVYKQSARWAYDSLFHLINFIRANMINDQAKLQLASQSQQWLPDAFSDMKSLYLRYSDSAFLDQAFQLVEQDKAFTLIEASRLKNATQLLPDHLQKQQEELSQLELRLSPSDSSKEMLVRKRLEFFEKLKREAPSYYALKYRGPDLSTEYIQKHLLDSNQAILNYFVEENEINVFVITQTGFILDTVSISRVQLKHWIRQFKAHLNPVGKGGEISYEKVDSFQQAAHQLYRILIEHADHKLKLPQRLIVIPHSELNDLSFDALLTDITSHSIPRAVQEGKFLIQSKSISYCFSVSMLDEMMKNTSEPQLQKTLSLYAPEFHPESKTIPELKNQKKEMIAIQHMVQNTKVANQGTKEHFLEDSKKFAYLHLCTHGFVSPDPNSSFIAFRQKSAQNDSNQFFFLRELYHHKMGQDLITLTACETALGDFRLGEGNISLARGFAYAGVRSFITTLWKIQTDGASQIIPGFYNFLFNKHLPKDVALAMSKREFLSRAKGVYPGNWAGMILVGNTSTLALEPASFWSKNGGYGILLIAMLMLIFWFRKHRAGFAA